MKKLALIALAFTLALSATAPAATVTFTLTRSYAGPGTFRLTAKASAGDNFGIASYGVQLVGNPVAHPTGSILTVNHNSLRAAALTGDVSLLEGPAGFTLLRSSDLNAAAPDVNAHTVSASQDTVTPTPWLIRGFGQTAGSVATALPEPVTGAISEGNPWNAELTIATGTYKPVLNGGNPGIPSGIHFIQTPGATTFANVFTSADGSATAPAQIVRVVTLNEELFPEPSSAVLAGLSLLCLVAARRRLT